MPAAKRSSTELQIDFPQTYEDSRSRSSMRSLPNGTLASTEYTDETKMDELCAWLNGLRLNRLPLSVW
jgi:hypothetical protein